MRNRRIAAVSVTLLLQFGCSGERSKPDRLSGHASAARILVLDNCDSDFRTPPFDDVVLVFTEDGKLLRKVGGLNIAQTVGGCRSLSVAPGGRVFVVCENVANKLTTYQMETGKRLWSLNGSFTSATVSPEGVIYALTNSGTIYGNQILVISEQGEIVQQAELGGFDIVLDPGRKVLWLAGADIKKCDLELRVLMKLTPIRWCAVSVDVNPDGSIWVAERQHPDVAQSQDRILKISSNGEILKAVNLKWSPLCLRVDRADGSLWVTGVGSRARVMQRLLDSIEKRTGRLQIGNRLRSLMTRPHVWSKTQKLDAYGMPLLEIDQGGFSIDIDQTDSSVWLAGTERVHHYSSQGAKLARFSGVSSDQKYIVVVPKSSKTLEPHAPPNSR